MRGFLNEIKNVAVNRATNKINNLISDALGGGRITNPGGRGGVDRSAFAKTNPFQGENIAYPEDIGSNDQGHFMIFEINEQQNAQVKFTQRGRNVQSQRSTVQTNLQENPHSQITVISHQREKKHLSVFQQIQLKNLQVR